MPEENPSLDIPESRHLERVLKFRDSLDLESDRGCALLAISFLDVELTRLLHRCFVQDDEMTETLFGPQSPFSTFSAKIDAGYYLGVVSATIKRELHLLRKVRNAFGHDPEPIS